MIDLPQDWTPPAAMRRIHVHWTAGGHRANAIDRRAYHLLVEGDGALVRGDRSIAANAPGSGLTPASHTSGANTGAIGLAMCAMAGARETPFSAGPAPLTAAQWHRACEVAALLARRYAIPVTRTTVLTHAEVEGSLGIRQAAKWDVTRLPFDGTCVGARAVGDRLRQEVALALDELSGWPGTRPLPPEARLPRFRVAGVAPSRLNVRRGPGGEVMGALPEGALVERLTAVGEWWHVRTPGGHAGWVSPDYLRATR